MMGSNASAEVADVSLDRETMLELVALHRPTAVSGCGLSDADLSGLDLSRWSFRRCDLARARLYGACWSGRNGFPAALRAPISAART